MVMKSESSVPIGDRLRKQRLEVLKRGLRETAKLLSITPAHLTDIELGRRTPSEDLLLRISRVYEIPEPELRSGWHRPDAVVEEVASQDAVTAEKVPEFLRSARKLNAQQWDRLIREADRLAKQKKGKPA